MNPVECLAPFFLVVSMNAFASSTMHGMMERMVTPLILSAIWQIHDMTSFGMTTHPLFLIQLDSLIGNCLITLSGTSNGSVYLLKYFTIL